MVARNLARPRYAVGADVGLPSGVRSDIGTVVFFFFSSRRRHTRFDCDWSSDVCSSDLPRRGRRSPDAGADRRRRRHVGGRRAVDRLDAGGTGKGPDRRGGAAAGCLVRRPAPTPARQRPDSGPHCRRHCPGTNRVAPVSGSKVMSGFIVNRHGRIVFPQNFFPRLDFGVFAGPEDFEAVIKRDFDEKCRTHDDLVARATSGHYRSRYELLRDVVSNLYWSHRYALTMYEKRPTRWRDTPRARPDVYLPIVPPGDAGPLARILEAAYRALPTAWDARLEDTVFGLLIEMVRSRRGAGVDVAARNPTVAQALANPERSEERRVGKEGRSRWSPYH